eukprot:1137576-Pelagomonas_calceolata.AAC.6
MSPPPLECHTTTHALHLQWSHHSCCDDPICIASPPIHLPLTHGTTNCNPPAVVGPKLPLA